MRIGVIKFLILAVLALTWSRAYPGADGLAQTTVEIGPVLSGARSSVGLGGRVTVSPTAALGLDMELVRYWDKDLTTGLFGAKVTPIRQEKFNVFFKFRPGFAHEDDIWGNGTRRHGRARFAVDLGAGLELSLMERLGLRFDLGDLYVNNSTKSHSLVGSMGLMFRF